MLHEESCELLLGVIVLVSYLLLDRLDGGLRLSEPLCRFSLGNRSELLLGRWLRLLRLFRLFWLGLLSLFL